MSEWINHVKAFQRQNPQYTYKESMSLAGPSYNETGSGLKSSLKKGKSKLKQAKKLGNTLNSGIDKYGKYVEYLSPEAAAKLQAAQGHINTAQNLTGGKVGGKFSFSKSFRKAKNSARQAKKNGEIIQPLVQMVDPKTGMEMNAALHSTDKVGGKLGHSKAQNKYITAYGGSFKAHGAGIHQGGFCPSCGSGVMKGGRLATNYSDLLSYNHPSYNPTPPDGY